MQPPLVVSRDGPLARRGDPARRRRRGDPRGPATGGHRAAGLVPRSPGPGGPRRRRGADRPRTAATPARARALLRVEDEGAVLGPRSRSAPNGSSPCPPTPRWLTERLIDAGDDGLARRPAGRGRGRLGRRRRHDLRLRPRPGRRPVGHRRRRRRRPPGPGRRPGARPRLDRRGALVRPASPRPGGSARGRSARRCPGRAGWRALTWPAGRSARPLRPRSCASACPPRAGVTTWSWSTCLAARTRSWRSWRPRCDLVVVVVSPTHLRCGVDLGPGGPVRRARALGCSWCAAEASTPRASPGSPVSRCSPRWPTSAGWPSPSTSGSARVRSRRGPLARAAAPGAGEQVAACDVRGSPSRWSRRCANGWRACPGELTPHRVAEALRETGRPVGDATVLAVYEALRHDVVGAGPLEPLLRQDGVTDVLVNGPDRSSSTAAPGSRRCRCGSPTRTPCVGWPSGWRRRRGAGSTTRRRTSTYAWPTAPGCTPSWPRCPGPGR